MTASLAFDGSDAPGRCPYRRSTGSVTAVRYRASIIAAPSGSASPLSTANSRPARGPCRDAEPRRKTDGRFALRMVRISCPIRAEVRRPAAVHRAVDDNTPACESRGSSFDSPDSSRTVCDAGRWRSVPARPGGLPAAPACSRSVQGVHHGIGLARCALAAADRVSRPAPGGAAVAVNASHARSATWLSCYWH